MKPMLAAKLHADYVKYPVIVQPKIDGIRCVITDKGAVSRNLKPIPNRYIREQLIAFPTGLDGELFVGKKQDNLTFNRTSSGIMSYEGEPDFTYMLFDLWNNKFIFTERFNELTYLYNLSSDIRKHCILCPSFIARTWSEIMTIQQRFLEEGYEGIIVRQPHTTYKFGRSTQRGGELAKSKILEDVEAEVIDFEELMHNDNEAEVDNLGRMRRSTAMAGLRPSGKLGALICTHPRWKEPFNIGSGFTEDDRVYIWANRDKYAGKSVTFKFVPHGSIDKPRHPTFKGFREDL